MTIRTVGAEMLDAGSRGKDRRTDVTKLIVAFHNFVNAFKDGKNMYFNCPVIRTGRDEKKGKT